MRLWRTCVCNSARFYFQQFALGLTRWTRRYGRDRWLQFHWKDHYPRYQPPEIQVTGYWRRCACASGTCLQCLLVGWLHVQVSLGARTHEGLDETRADLAIRLQHWWNLPRWYYRYLRPRVLIIASESNTKMTTTDAQFARDYILPATKDKTQGHVALRFLPHEYTTACGTALRHFILATISII